MSYFKKLKKIRQQSAEAMRQTEAVEEFVNQFDLSQLFGNTLNDGEFIALSPTAKEFNHGLSRKYKGFKVLDLDAGAVIYTVKADSDDRSITLRSSISCNAKIWVF